MYNPFELAAKAQAALQKINSNKQQVLQEQDDSAFFKRTKADYARMAFEEFDESDFDTKSKLDAYFFKNMVRNIPEEHLQDTVQIVNNLYENVESIYKYVNVKPKTYGFNLSSSLNNSDEVLESQAQGYINTFLKDNYYNMTSSQREEKYFPKIKPLAESLVIENSLNETEALEYASKVVLMEDLIRRICFPLTIQSFIEETIQDDAYAELFEKEGLVNLWDSFNTKIHNLAKLVSMLV